MTSFGEGKTIKNKFMGLTKMDDWSLFPKWDTTNFSLTHYYLIHTRFNIRGGLKLAVTSYNDVVKKRYTLFKGKNISSLTQSPIEACSRPTKRVTLF